MEDTYTITLYPMKEGEKVVVDGKDYTTSAQTHNIDVNGRKFFVRRNWEGNGKVLESFVNQGLAELLSGIKSSKVEVKATISVLGEL